MNLKLTVMIFALLTATRMQGPQIIDFTYTHVLQEGGTSIDRTQQIVIFPDEKQIEKYYFPSICQLKDKLDQGMDHSTTTANSVDIDQHLKGLRIKILELLRLAQEMKNIRRAVQEIEDDYQPSVEGFNSSLYSSDLKRLAEKQSYLSSLKQQIQKSTLKLNNLIEQYNLHPKNQQFNQLNLQYRISFALSKITFYSNLKKSIKDKKSSQHSINFNTFFSDLQDQFKTINSHLDDIDSVINNYALKKTLQQKIGSWNNKIEIDRLLLNEKVDCNNSKGKIKTHNHFNQEIKKTFKDLREKKKEFNGMNNTQCQGVAKKLQEKIRSELKIANRVFICSEGLEGIQRNLTIKEAQLGELRKKLEDLKLGELEVYQKNYNKTVEDISRQFEVMKTFKVDQYVHNETQIDKLLSEATKERESAQRDLTALPDSSHSPTDFKELQLLVQEIKKEKARYCKQYAAYDVVSRQIWSKINQQQKRQRQLAHMRSQYITYGQRFLALEEKYKEISNEIIRYLEEHQSTE